MKRPERMTKCQLVTYVGHLRAMIAILQNENLKLSGKTPPSTPMNEILKQDILREKLTAVVNHSIDEFGPTTISLIGALELVKQDILLNTSTNDGKEGK